MSIPSNKTALFLFALFILISTVYLFVAPPTTAPDEIAHLAYPRHILIEQELPAFTSAQDTWESHQPPLYYLTSIPIVKLFESQSTESQLTLQRLTSLFFLVVSYVILIAAAKNLFTSDNHAYSFFAVFSGLPVILYTAGSFSNDITLFLAGSLLLYSISTRNKITTDRYAIGLGICLGIVALTKYHAFPFALITFIYVLSNKPFRLWLLSGISALSISGWWYVHNVERVGDITGLKYTFLLWANQQSDGYSLSTLGSFMAKLFASSVGVFGKMNISFHPIVYSFFAIVGLLLVFLWLRYSKTGEEKIMAFAFIATLAVLVYQSFTFFQPQGRYLLAVLPGIGLLFARTLSKLPARLQSAILTISIFGVILLNGYGIAQIRSHYIQDPITIFEANRSINLLQFSFIGLPTYDPNKETVLRLDTNKTFYTLADLRFPTDAKPLVTIEVHDPQDVQTTIYWKILGMHEFSKERSVTIPLTAATQTIALPESDHTLIQDLQFSFSNIQTTLSIQTITLHN